MARRKKTVEEQPEVEETVDETEEIEHVPTVEEADAMAEEEEVAEAEAEEEEDFGEIAVMVVKVRDLRNAMLLLSPVVPKNPSLKVLSHILLKDGYAIANNMEAAVSVEVPGAVDQCLLPAQTVLEMLKYIPANEELTISQNRRDLSFAWSEGKASYTTENPNNFPPMPETLAIMEQTIDGDLLVTSLSSMLAYCATNDPSRPVLTGISVFLGDNIELAAGDGYRMALKQIPINIPPTEELMTLILPSNSVRILRHLWDKGPRELGEPASIIDVATAKGKLHLSFGVNVFGIRFGNLNMVSQRISGTPPNFHQLIPTNPVSEIRIFAPDLERAIRRVKDIAKNSNGIVRFSWANAEMTVAAYAPDKGKVEATFPVDLQGESGMIGFNIKYLLEYIKDKTGMITMGVSTKSSPAVFRYANSPVVVIMPMHVEW